MVQRGDKPRRSRVKSSRGKTSGRKPRRSRVKSSRGKTSSRKPRRSRVKSSRRKTSRKPRRSRVKSSRRKTSRKPRRSRVKSSRRKTSSRKPRRSRVKSNRRKTSSRKPRRSRVKFDRVGLISKTLALKFAMMNGVMTVRTAMALQRAHKPLDPGDKIAWEDVRIGEEKEAEFFKTYALNIPNIKVRIIPDRMTSTVLDDILWKLPKNVEYLDCRGIPAEFHSLKNQLPALKVLLTDSVDLTDDPAQDQGSGLGTERLPPTLIELYANCPDLRFVGTKKNLPRLKTLDASASKIVDLSVLPATLDDLSVNNCTLIAVDISETLPNLRVFSAMDTKVIPKIYTEIGAHEDTDEDTNDPIDFNYTMFPSSIKWMALDDSDIHIFNNAGSREHFKRLNTLSFTPDETEAIEFLPGSLEELIINRGEEIATRFPIDTRDILPKLKRLHLATEDIPDLDYQFPATLKYLSIGDLIVTDDE